MFSPCDYCKANEELGENDSDIEFGRFCDLCKWHEADEKIKGLLKEKQDLLKLLKFRNFRTQIPPEEFVPGDAASD